MALPPCANQCDVSALHRFYTDSHTTRNRKKKLVMDKGARKEMKFLSTIDAPVQPRSTPQVGDAFSRDP